jgi:peptidyl-prolyl cis-trans isomerase D
VQENRGNTKLSSAERAKLQKEVIDSLVNRSLILQAAHQQGIIIGAEEIRDFLRKIPQFQENGQFSVLKYKELIRGQGMSEARFEEKIVEDLLVQKMNGMYQKITADDKMIQEQEDLVSKIKLDIAFIKKNKGELVSDSELSQAEVESYATANSGKIATYFKEHTKEFTVEEAAKAQHILIKITPEFPEDKALAKIKEIAAQVKGDNFSDLAKKYSEDPGSKDRGGDLGFFTREKMVKEFSDQAFATPVGQVSPPFKSSFGYHILKVNERTEAKQPKLEDVKMQIAKKLLKEEKVGGAVAAIKKELATPASAEAMVKQKGWTWDSTGPFGLGDMMIPKVGDNPQVISAAMSLDEKNPVFKDVIEKDGVYYIVKFKSLEKSNAPSKDNTMDIFKQIFARQKSYETFQNWMDHLRKNASIKINEKILSQN